MNEDPKLRAKLDKARNEIMRDPRYGVIVSLLLAREDVFKTDLPYPTAASDGVRHYWHPDFVAEQTTDELRKTKLHELGHDWLFHTDGRFKRLVQWFKAQGLSDQQAMQLANESADEVVNNFLRDCGESLDNSWVCDRKYKEWSMEEVAQDKLASKTQQDPDSEPKSGEGEPKSGAGGGHELMESATPEQQAQAKQATMDAVADGSMMDAIKQANGMDDGDPSKGQGSNTMGSMLDAARANRQPYVDWRLELADFCGSSKTDEKVSTYSRVCRRPIEGLIRPGKKRVGKPRVGVILDTSGSMYCELPKLMVELEAMSDDGFSFDVLCTDGDVYGPYSFNGGEFDYRDLPLEGGGGSNMEPAFEQAVDYDVDAWVFCTDGCIQWPSKDLLAQLPPCLLIEVDRTRKSDKGKRFHSHILLKD